MMKYIYKALFNLDMYDQVCRCNDIVIMYKYYQIGSHKSNLGNKKICLNIISQNKNAPDICNTYYVKKNWRQWFHSRMIYIMVFQL